MAPGEVEGLGEERSVTQVDQIPSVGAERTGVLDAGVRLDHLDIRSIAADSGDTGTQRADLGVVVGVEKVATSRQQLSPGILPVEGVRRLAGRGHDARVAGVRDEQLIRAEWDGGVEIGNGVGKDLTCSCVDRNPPQFPLGGKQQGPPGVQTTEYAPSPSTTGRDSSSENSRRKRRNEPLASLAVKAIRSPSGDSANDWRMPPPSR